MSEEHIAGPVRGSSELPNAQQAMYVAKADLPLHCPMPSMTLWDSHPKVYLPIEETGQERCPYCGTVYILQEFKNI